MNDSQDELAFSQDIIQPPDDAILSRFFPNFKDFNFGIILVSLHILLDMGAVQHVFDFIVVPLKIPFLVSTGTIIYGLYLLFSGKAKLNSATSKSLLILLAFYVLYSLTCTQPVAARGAIWKYFLQYFCNFIILTTCITRPSQFILIIDIFLLAVAHTCFRGVRSGGLIWGDTFLGDENEVSVLVACALAFAFNLFFCYKSTYKRLFYLLCVFLYIWMIFTSASRGGLLSLCLVGILCWLLIRKKVFALFAVLIAIVLILNFAPKRLFNRIQTLQTQGTEELTAFDRIYGWHVAMLMFKDHPILGVGPANYAPNFPNYSTRYSKVAKRVPNRSLKIQRVCHSTEIEWLATTGIIGAIILISLLITLLGNWLFVKKSRKIVGKELSKHPQYILLETLGHSSAISVAAFWVGGFFITIIIFPFFWILVPMSVVANNLIVDFDSTMYAANPHTHEDSVANN